MSENEVASPAPVVSSGSPPRAKSRAVFWIVLLVLLCFIGPTTLFGIVGAFWFSRARGAMEYEQKRAFEAVQAEERVLEAVRRAELESKLPVPTTNSAMGSGMGSGMGAAPGMGSGMAPGMPGMLSMMPGSSGAATVEGMPPLDDPRVNMIRVELQFGKFGVTTVDALVVDRVNGNEVVYVAPAGPLQPRRGKVNGREVVERPVLVLRDSRIPDHMFGTRPGGMGGMPGMEGSGVGMSVMGRGGSVILSRDRAPWEAPDAGVCIFRGFSTAQPIQLLGDLPEASVGDQVSIVSAEGKLDISDSKITAVGVDVEAQADRPRVSKAIQLDFPSSEGALRIPDSRANIPLGALLVNARNQPVGMVVRIDGGPATAGNSANDALVVYATPIAQVFTAAADWAVTPPVSESSAYVPGEKSPPVAESSEESDEEWRKLEAEARTLAKQASQAMGDERTMLLEKLTTIVGRQFERRQQLRKLRIDELEQRLGKLREEHQTREQAKTEEVQKRIETMVPPPPAAQKP